MGLLGFSCFFLKPLQELRTRISNSATGKGTFLSGKESGSQSMFQAQHHYCHSSTNPISCLLTQLIEKSFEEGSRRKPRLGLGQWREQFPTVSFISSCEHFLGSDSSHFPAAPPDGVHRWGSWPRHPAQCESPPSSQTHRSSRQLHLSFQAVLPASSPTITIATQWCKK